MNVKPKAKTVMKVAIQVPEFNSAWNETTPVLHDVRNREEAVKIAHAISRQFGGVTVRVTYPQPDALEENSDDLCGYVSRLNGSYYQAR